MVDSKLSERNLPAHIDIEREVQETKYGQIMVTLRVHNSVIKDVVYQSFRRKRYDLDNPTE